MMALRHKSELSMIVCDDVVCDRIVVPRDVFNGGVEFRCEGDSSVSDWNFSWENSNLTDRVVSNSPADIKEDNAEHAVMIHGNVNFEVPPVRKGMFTRLAIFANVVCL